MVSGLHRQKYKKKKSKTTVMRRVRKFLSESENLKEINRQRKSSDTSGLIDATLIEEIMAQILQLISEAKEEREIARMASLELPHAGNWARSTRSSEVECLIWNRSSWNLTHFKGRTYQAEELESSQEAGTQAWTAKCWRRLDELCTSSYSWCWRIDESVHIRLGGGTCHSFRFGSIDKLMIWNDSSSLWHVMTNRVEFHASNARSTLSASCF